MKARKSKDKYNAGILGKTFILICEKQNICSSIDKIMERRKKNINAVI
jgi:hypothetical protein